MTSAMNVMRLKRWFFFGLPTMEIVGVVLLLISLQLGLGLIGLSLAITIIALCLGLKNA